MSKTLSYTPELYVDVMVHMVEYFQTGETVCGALDPAVIEVSHGLGALYPELAGLDMVRVIDRYVGPWSSSTELEFSDRRLTAEEYAAYEEYVDGLE